MDSHIRKTDDSNRKLSRRSQQTKVLGMASDIASHCVCACSSKPASDTKKKQKKGADLRTFYTMGPEIGKGGFGTVNECTEKKTEEVYVIQASQRQ